MPLRNWHQKLSSVQGHIRSKGSLVGLFAEPATVTHLFELSSSCLGVAPGDHCPSFAAASVAHSHSTCDRKSVTSAWSHAQCAASLFEHLFVCKHTQLHAGFFGEMRDLACLLSSPARPLSNFARNQCLLIVILNSGVDDMHSSSKTLFCSHGRHPMHVFFKNCVV